MFSLKVVFESNAVFLFFKIRDPKLKGLFNCPLASHNTAISYCLIRYFMIYCSVHSVYFVHFSVTKLPCLAGFQPPVEVPDNCFRETTSRAPPKTPTGKQDRVLFQSQKRHSFHPWLEPHILSSQKLSFISGRCQGTWWGRSRCTRLPRPQPGYTLHCQLASSRLGPVPLQEEEGIRKFLKRKGVASPPS